jgi:hypothetical protein
MNGPDKESSVSGEEVELWRSGAFQCVMVSCCSGAELQLRLADHVLLRELYPDKSDLYERARDLQREINDRSGGSR